MPLINLAYVDIRFLFKLALFEKLNISQQRINFRLQQLAEFKSDVAYSIFRRLRSWAFLGQNCVEVSK